jgi:hypothetical protein
MSKTDTGKENATDPRYVVGGMAVGLILGIAAGVTLDSLAVGIIIGMGTGVAVGIRAGTSAHSDR